MQGYSSFGRHFTTPEKLEPITDCLMGLLQPGTWLGEICVRHHSGTTSTSTSVVWRTRVFDANSDE
jgi:hypothetical protein